MRLKILLMVESIFLSLLEEQGLEISSKWCKGQWMYQLLK